MSKVIAQFEQYVKLSNNLHYDAMLAAVRVEDPGKLADTIASHLVITVEEKQNLLEIFSPQERLTRIAAILEAEVERLVKEPRVEPRAEESEEDTRRDFGPRPNTDVAVAVEAVKLQLRDLERRMRTVDARLRAAERTIKPALWSVVALAVVVLILALVVMLRR